MNSYQMVLHRPVETAGIFGDFVCSGFKMTLYGFGELGISRGLSAGISIYIEIDRRAGRDGRPAMGYWLRETIADDGQDRSGYDGKNDDPTGLWLLEPDGRNGPQGIQRDAGGRVRRGHSPLRHGADVWVRPGGRLPGGVPRAASRGGDGDDEVRDSAGEKPGMDGTGARRGAARGESVAGVEARDGAGGGQRGAAGGEGQLYGGRGAGIAGAEPARVAHGPHRRVAAARGHRGRSAR